MTEESLKYEKAYGKMKEIAEDLFEELWVVTIGMGPKKDEISYIHRMGELRESTRTNTKAIEEKFDDLIKEIEE